MCWAFEAFNSPDFFCYCDEIVVLIPGIASVQPQPPPLQLSPLAGRLSPGSPAGILTVRGSVQSCKAFYSETQDQITTAASLLLTLKIKQNNWPSALFFNTGSLPTCPYSCFLVYISVFVISFGFYSCRIGSHEEFSWLLSIVRVSVTARWICLRLTVHQPAWNS